MPGKHHEMRSVRWDLDPVILARLDLVAARMNKKQQLRTIAAALGVSMSTINRDAARVRELWRRASLKDIDDRRAESRANYERMQTVLWKQVDEAERDGRSIVALMRTLMDLEDKITKLDGTVVTRVDMTTKGESIANRDPRQLTDAQLESMAGLSSEA